MLCELLVYIVSVSHEWKVMFMLPVICDNTNSLYSLIFLHGFFIIYCRLIFFITIYVVYSNIIHLSLYF